MKVKICITIALCVFIKYYMFFFKFTRIASFVLNRIKSNCIFDLSDMITSYACSKFTGIEYNKGTRFVSHITYVTKRINIDNFQILLVRSK